MPRQGGQSLRVLISAGPTREPLDPARFLSNYSTGTMGACLAREALRRGHRVTMVNGPTTAPMPEDARMIAVESARQMQAALRRAMRHSDVLIMAAAVCDFEPVRISVRKLSRRGRISLTLRATPDIVKHLPRRRGQVVVGFALETSTDLARVCAKLRSKRLDLIVGQVAGRGRSPFGARPLNACLVERSGLVRRLGRGSKPRLARAILDKAERLWYGDPLV
jgi:phosphopantothenoylcysteine decarboxylase/phosphopantothenate--cysteine ligase